MNLRMAVAAGFLFSLVLLGARSSAQEENVASLQARFDKEPDSVQKAKILKRLGEAQFSEARRAEKKNDFQAVGLLMEKYRDNVREALKALKGQHTNAEKHSGGYRGLEIQTRKSLRELEDTLLIAPDVYRPPLRIVRKDLEDMDDEMLRLLFPRRPGETPLQQPPPKSEMSENPGSVHP